jgi:excinuclease ABC subunit A
MNKIEIRNAFANNLKNVNLDIPLGRLVAIVGKSGSGKSSLVYDVLYKTSQGHDVKAKLSKLPKTYAIAQKVKPSGEMSLGETNLNNINKVLKGIKSGELLIVDEPCAGMSKNDRTYIISLLHNAVRKGVSVIVVEHSKDVIAESEYVIEFGPDSGANGGEVIFQGSIEEYKNAKTPTSEYVFSDKASLVDYRRNPNDKVKIMQNKNLGIKGITKYNLKDYDLEIPLGSLVCISGETGVGKSTLLSVVYGALFKGKDAWKLRQGFKSIEGKPNVRRSYLVDQSSLSLISTSTPATYLAIWDNIRDLFASLPESKSANLQKSHFSFNNKIGQETTEKLKNVKYNEKTIFDVLDMTVDQAINLFSGLSLVVRKLGFLQEVGLGYLTLGQKSGTLSGGEAQRVRLAKILSKKLSDRCIYILDTPSRGLHLSNLPVLIKVFQKIIDKNNTVLIAENKEELIKNCDYVINLTK